MTRVLLTIAGLIERWRGEVSRSTLAHWRVQGKGPTWTKVGRKVLYPLEAVEAYEAEKERGGYQTKPG